MVKAVRERLGSYLLAEGDDTLEGLLLAALSRADGSLAVAECGTHGAVAGRLVAADEDGSVFKRGGVSAAPSGLAHALGLDPASCEPSADTAARFAEAVRVSSVTTHGLAVLVADGATAGEGMIYIAISRADAPTIERTACIVGGAQRVRVGGVEMALDGMRRVLSGLSVDDPVDFEKQT